MPGRRLNPEEAALWARVMATVTPIPGRKAGAAAPVAKAPPKPAKTIAKPPVAEPMPVFVPPAKPKANTLDGSWDRKLVRGAVMPDVTIDLHGHSLQSAYSMLDRGIANAIAHGNRVILLVTGKPPRPESERPHARGAIRAAVGDWLAASRHASDIAAVRGAHPRHGGAGALYIIIRRKTDPLARIS